MFTRLMIMSSMASFSDPSETIENAVFSTDDATDIVPAYDEPQDMPAENSTGRILGVDPLATASDLGII